MSPSRSIEIQRRNMDPEVLAHVTKIRIQTFLIGLVSIVLTVVLGYQTVTNYQLSKRGVTTATVQDLCQAYQHVPYPMWLVDSQNHTTWQNETFFAFMSSLPDLDMTIFERKIESLAKIVADTGQEVRASVTVQAKDTSRNYCVIMYPIVTNNQCVGSGGMIIDINNNTENLGAIQ